MFLSRQGNFAQALGVVGVVAFGKGQMVGEKLAGDDRHNRRKPLLHALRQWQRRDDLGQQVLPIRDDEKLGAAGLEPQGKITHRVEHLAAGGDDQRREAAANHSDGAMHEIGREVGLGLDRAFDFESVGCRFESCQGRLNPTNHTFSVGLSRLLLTF
jgi:hypothetical protein